MVSLRTNLRGLRLAATVAAWLLVLLGMGLATVALVGRSLHGASLEQSVAAPELKQYVASIRQGAPFELARAKSARLLGDLVAMLGTLKGVPAGYSKDLQEDKALQFDAFDTLALVLPAITGALATLQPDGERMRAALDASLRATDLADALVEAGIPFRESHALVGRLVREAERTQTALDRMSPAATAAIHPRLAEVLERLGDWDASIERRATAGGSLRASVEAQLEALERAFAPVLPQVPR